MRKMFLILTVFALCAVLAPPATAGTFGAYGSYWDSKDAKSTTGFGVKFGFNFTKAVELEFHGTYYQKFEDTFGGADFKLSALPVGGGLRFNLMPEKKFNISFGAGLSYVFMHSNIGSIDNKLMYYGLAGFDVGSEHTRFMAEAVYRRLRNEIDNSPAAVFDVKFDGWSINSGILWKW